MRRVTWKILTIIGLCFLLTHLPTNLVTGQEISSEGPTFSDYDDFYADFLSENASIWFHVTVTDSDGIDMVIGSTKQSSEPLWHNITLEASESNLSRYYGNYQVILPSSGSSIFEVKYYASDSLGNWNMSDTVFFHLNNIGLDSPRLDLVLITTITMLSIVAIALIIIYSRIKEHR